MSIWFRKLHRWVALVFALPLVVVLLTGLVLSFEPWIVTSSGQPGSLKPEQIRMLLARYDPGGQARAISYRSYDGTLTIGAGRGGGVVVDVASGERRAASSTMASVFLTARQMHERLLLDAGWLVVASTIAMLVLVPLGLGLGWPRWSNNLSGWHKVTAWGLLPLIILSPLTALFMVWGVTFASQQAPRNTEQRSGSSLKLAEAAAIVGRAHDLSGLVWLRPRGGAMLARIVEGGEYRVYRVTSEGTDPMPRNWPRLWHEGNFAGMWSALLNVITSLALIGLLVTGVMIWAKRALRRSRVKAAKPIAQAA